MGGLNPSIETDLVGELVRFDHRQALDLWNTVAIGRIRAVTAGDKGSMLVWIEIIDDEGLRAANLAYNGADFRIGDIASYWFNPGDTYARLHLIKGR